MYRSGGERQLHVLGAKRSGRGPRAVRSARASSPVRPLAASPPRGHARTAPRVGPTARQRLPHTW